MNTFLKKVAGAVRLVVFIVLFAVLCPNPGAAQVGLRVPEPPRVVHLFQPHIYGLEFYQQDSTFFQKPPSAYKRRVHLDSTASFISVSEGIDNTQFQLPAVVDIDTYIRLRTAFDTRELWKKNTLNALTGQVQKSSGAIELDIPFRIKSKAFTRIFGSDRIGLRVTGNISFDLSGRTEKRSGSAISALENQNTFSPRFRQTQQFTVEGKIGDKVTVSVEQNSEATVDIDNTLKLRYDGGEDEIVQKIEAGNIALSLPSTKYVIFGGSNQGLFGLKTQMQMGDLYFTAIASLEKGQQQELSVSGGSKKSSSEIKDYNFIRNRYFFADSWYHDNYETGFKDNPTQFVVPADRKILQLEVWQSTGITDTQKRKGIAVIDPAHYWNQSSGYKNVDIDALNTQLAADTVEYYYGFFKRLEEGKDYTYDEYRGFFTLNQTADEQSALAVSFVTEGQSVNPSIPTTGTMSTSLSDSLQPVVLRLIKPKAMQPDNKNTWPLMMRNVYSLGGTKIEREGFELRLENNVNGNHEIYPEGSNKSYLNLLGLDVLDVNGAKVEGGDEQIDNNRYIVNLSDGTLMFPALRPFNPQKGSRFEGRLPEKNLVDIYDVTPNQTTLAERSQFEMLVTSKSTRSTFDLGFYVLENSEVVTAGGQTLVRDKDYTIDYFSGQLTLISAEAKRSSAQLNIKYERANLFQLDKKTIFGGRLEYRFLDNSFVGLTALYLNKTTLDRRVRVGQEPFSNFVWDVNAAFKFKPRFITKAMNALPFLETNAESHINIEGEFAQVLPNPNSLNNSKTGDNDGVAYVDDFESSKRTTTLGIRYRTWSMASAPKYMESIGENDDLDPVEVDEKRGKIVWFNPYNQTLIKDIWPNRDVNAQTGQTTDVLGIDIMRPEGSSPDSAWAGIMRSTINFSDQQKTKYIEMWIQGYDGTVNIDIGRISEDWYIKGKNLSLEDSRGNLNTEDKNSNGLLELEEDIGIDGVPDGQPGDDPFDNWSEPKAGALNMYDGYLYDGINGTEGNHNSRDARYPDTEDLDGDGDISTIDEYFEYSFSLDSLDTKTHAREWIKGSTDKKWRLFRIPLNKYTKVVGNPDPNFQQIFFVRLWFSNLPVERRRIKIATFDFVGNEWEERGVAVHKDSAFVKNDSLFTLATYNTEENADPPQSYESPPGVTGVRDRITKALSKEQSLVMSMNDLLPGQYAEAKKTMFSAMDLLNYKNLRMFVHGDKQLPSEPPLEISPGDTVGEFSQLRFYLRFGSDANNYYEFGRDIYAGWYKGNEIDIDLDEMAAIKSIDSLNIGSGDTLIFRKKLPGSTQAYYLAHGLPNLKNIRYFIIGVKHRGDEMGRNSLPFTGEVWLDELRLSNVRRNTASALRLSTSVALADVITFNAQWESKDADFHNISTQFGKGDTQERQNYRGKIVLDKFLPDVLDLSIPVDGSASFSRSIPKYKPKTDELTGYGNDTFDKKLRSLFGTRALDPALEEISSTNEVFGWGTTIKTRSKSKRWYLRYTIDEMLFDFDYSKKNSSNWEILFNRSEQYKESFRYGIPFSKSNYVQPFTILKNFPVLKKFSDQKLYYSPQNIKFSLNVFDSEAEKLLRREGSEKTRIVNTGTTRSVSTGYTLFPSMKFSYGRTHKTDADFVGLKHEDILKEILTKANFGKETDISQSFKGDFNPKVTDWFKPSYSYSNNFSYNLTNGYKYRQTSNKTTQRVGLTLSPGKLLKSIYSPKGQKKKSRRRGSRRRGSKNRQQTKSETKKGEAFSLTTPLMWIYDVFAGWSSVKTTITKNESNRQQYLSAMPKWKYQFGFTKDPGVGQDTEMAERENILLVGPSNQKTFSVRTSTSLSLTSFIKTTLSHDYSLQESNANYGQTRSGSRSSSYFSLNSDPLSGITGISGINAFIPDWTVSVNKIEKLFFFPSFAKSITLEHSHSGKYAERLTLNPIDKKYEAASSTYSNNWQPLIGVNIRTKWGVNAKIRMTNSTSFSAARAAGSTKSETDQLTFSMSYKKSTGFKIPIPIWPFKGKTFKNEINFNLTFDTSNNRTYQRQFGQDKFQERQNNKTWKLRPSATYRFSSRVTGSMFYERGFTENKVSGKYTYNEFGITVNIAIHD